VPVPASAQVRTQAPGGGDIRWLGQAGLVASLKWSSVVPGGADQFSGLLQVPAGRRDPAVAVGRQVQVYRGLQCVWDGQLDEPTPQQDGWLITAHGAGTFGNQFRALWTATWASGDGPDSAVNGAIGRGMRWVNPGIGHTVLPASAWLGQTPDNSSLAITDVMTLICARGGLLWKVTTGVSGNLLSIYPLPTATTRLLVATTPVARQVAGLVNAVSVRYQDSGTPTFNTVWATSPALIAAYGRIEQYIDISSAGTVLAAVATSVGNYALARYQQVAWGGPFVVAPGQYLTNRGSPVDLGTERAGEVVRPLGADFGGQVNLGLPPTFIAGQVEYDDETGTLAVTPWGSVRTDWQALVAARTTFHPGRGDPFGFKGTTV